MTDPGRAKRLFAEAYDAAAASFACSADRLVYTYPARPLAGSGGPVLDVAAGSGALGRLLPDAVTLDLSAAQLRAQPDPARAPVRPQAGGHGRAGPPGRQRPHTGGRPCRPAR